MNQGVPASGVFKNVLCPVDFSDCAADGLHYAAAVARCQDARLAVLHADRFSAPAYFTHGQLTQLAEQAKQWRAGAQRSLEEFVRAAVGLEPLDAPAFLSEAPTVEAILDMASKLHADLIVMGTHGRSGVNRLLLGSVAERVLQLSRIPLLVVRTGLSRIEMPAQRVLCPVNDSSEARRALDLATLVAGCFGASVTVLHVRTPRQAGSISDLHTWIPDAQRERCPIDEVIRHGEAAREIVIAASDSNCDLVVIGARHHRFLDMTVLGTTTERVVRHSPCPVMAVPLEAMTTSSHSPLMPR
ncbi:MAG: universal stress protein [Thermoanaerobaculia bacterium]